jgi:transcriptional regulator with XRE-family HTH domain
MPGESLAPSLESYQIGPRIHALRKGKNLSLVKLGEHTGMSAGLLSKIERGRLIPTLPTLLRIAMVFGVGLDRFFSNEATPRPTATVVRRKERLRLPNRTDGGAPTYFFESLDFPVTDRKMDAFFATFESGAPATEPHIHSGAEVIYVVSGALDVSIDGENTTLSQGDSIYFDSSNPHSYRQSGRQTCCAVVVVTN